MGGGNAQKTAISRQRHQAEAQAAKNSGGGKKGQMERSGINMVCFVFYKNILMVNMRHNSYAMNSICRKTLWLKRKRNAKK